ASALATGSPVPAPRIMWELEEVSAKDLDKFIETHLLPDTHFRRQIKEAVHIISTFLKERCFQGAPHPVRVSKVVKGGSSGKGTSLRGQSDADLVVFLNNLGSFQDQLDNRGTFIWEIKRQLEACQREEIFEVEFEVGSLQWQKPRALSFTLMHPHLHEGVEFDVLPAFDVLDRKRGKTRGRRCSINNDKHRLPTEHLLWTRHCSVAMNEPNKDPGQVPVPDCFSTSQCKKQLGKPLPQQYALELLTVYAWERGSRQTEFSTAQGFRTVLQLVLNYQQLCIYWTKYYNFEHPIIGQYLKTQLAKPRPVILDPADPTGNVAGGDPHSWWRLAEEARNWLHYPCFLKGDGSPVSSWNVPVRPSASSLSSSPH
ncbi:hypothetical protein PANDA_014750, partial [Ailuropoda melanoleuca]